MRTPSPSHKLYYSTDANTNAHNTFIQSNTRFDGAGDSNLPRWVQHIIAKEMDQADKIRKASVYACVEAKVARPLMLVQESCQENKLICTS